MSETFQNLSQLQLGSYEPLFLFLKFIFFASAIFLFSHIIYLVYKLNIVRDKLEFYKEAVTKRAIPVRKEEFISKWNKIKERFATGQEAEYKLAIIEADKLFDELLKRMGYEGKDMGERMEQLTPMELPNLSAVWESHKARNYLAHDTNYHISFSDARRIVQNYEDAFTRLKILE